MRASIVVAVLVALLVSACAPVAATPSPTPTPTDAASASTSVLPHPTDALARALDVHVASWQPSGPTVIVTTWAQRVTEVVAVRLDGSASAPLVTVRDDGQVPALVRPRPDGTALAISLATTRTTHRLALVDLMNGSARWLSDPAAGETDNGAAWAPDGRSLYFGRSNASGDLGVSHVALDGALLDTLPPASFYGAFSNVTRVTAEGVLVGSDEFNGPTLWLADLATGKKTSFGAHYSTLASWRSKPPRALVGAYTNIAAPGAGYLAVWDDLTDTRVTLENAP